MNNIVAFNSINELTAEQQQDIIRIFFESSSVQEFPDEAAALAFLKKWTEYYFSPKYPGENYAYVGVNNEVLGYLSGAMDSRGAQSYFDQINVCYSVFALMFSKYPAHFHINVAAKARGQKIGSLLIQHYCSHLRNQGCPGVHIVTSPDAENVEFYKQSQFTYTLEKECKRKPLLFMGRTI